MDIEKERDNEKKEEKKEYKVLHNLSPAKWYSKLLVTFPKISFVCCLILPVLLLIILLGTAALGAFELSPDALLEDRDDRAYISSNAYRLARRESVNEFDNILNDNSRLYYPLTLVFEAKDSNQVFTQKNIEKMKDIQTHILRQKHYQKYCYKGSSDVCEDPVSVLSYFYPEIKPDGTIVYNGKGDRIVTNIEGTLRLMSEGEGVFQYADFFVEDDFDDDLESSITRIVINFGMPFDHKSIEDDEDFADMKDDIDQFQEDLEDYLNDADTDDMKVLYLSNALARAEIQRLLYGDLALAIVSILLVYIFMCFQTGSFWLATLGIFQIILAFPCAILTYYFVFNIPYFGGIHMLGVFVVLGIGADDTFIFIDTFKDSRKRLSSIQDRLEWSYSKAGKAMLVTSATTIATFIITAVATPFVALQTFGIFAALLVFWDYVLVMTFYPTVICLYAMHFEYKSLFCCVDNSLWNFIPLIGSKEWGSWRESNAIIRTITGQSNEFEFFPLYTGDEAAEQLDEDKQPPKRLVNRFLDEYYETFVLHKWRRFIVLAYFIVFLIIIIIGASFTQPADEAVQFVGEGTNFGDVIELNEDFAQNPGTLLQVTVVWGLDGLDQDSGYRYDELIVGEVEYDRDFDPSSVAAQDLVLNVCSQAKNYDNDMQISDDNGPDSTVKCYQRDFRRWMIENYPNINLPVTGYQYVQKLREFVNSKEYFEKYNDMIGFVDNRLSFVSVTFNTTQDIDDNYEEGFKHRDAWWDYIDSLNDNAPNGMKSARGVCSEWSWWHVQQKLFEQALLGMLISLVIAFCCVTLFTMNIFMGIFTTIAIASVVIAVLCLLVAFGWQLGAMEAIASIMVVGLSVDYSVHLAHAYVESKSKTRWARIRHALDSVGISIISGAITTLLASVVLVIAVIIFLKRFGILLLCIVFFSLFFSFGEFITILAIFGPQGNVGNLKVLIRPITRPLLNFIDNSLYQLFSRIRK